MSEKAIELFQKITRPDEVLVCLLFNACAQVCSSHALNVGCKIWFDMPSSYYKNKHILTAALDMFVKCGDLANAEKLFDKKKHTVSDYGQLMQYYNDHQMPMNTLDLYEKMKKERIRPDVITFVLLIDACAQIGIISRCRSIVEQIPSTILPNLQLETSLIHMWVNNLAFA